MKTFNFLLKSKYILLFKNFKFKNKQLKHYCLLAFASLLFSFSAMSQGPTFGGAQGPTLLSGTLNQQGSRYLYTDVVVNVNGTTSNADAVVTIVELNNIIVNSVDTVLGVDNRFEPTTTTTAAGGYAEWEIVFVEDGTANASTNGTPIEVDSYTLQAIDVDGNEFFEVLVADSFLLEAGTTPPTGTCPQGSGVTTNLIGCPTELVVSANGPFTRFQSGSNFASGVHVGRTEYIVSVVYSNVSTVRFRNGRSTSGSSRLNSVSFLGEVNFVNGTSDPDPTNDPPVVVDNLGNTVLENSGANGPYNVLTGASDVDGNLDPTTVVLIDPSNSSNLGYVGTDLVIPGVGTYSVDNTGNVTFTPDANHLGNANINFEVLDTSAERSNTGTLGITVLPILDSDNDGILDSDEAGGSSFDPSLDADGDGIKNYLDTSDSTPGFPVFTDTNSDGVNDLYDNDGDGVPDFLDLDSDNDGIYDVIEAGGVDGDNDGRIGTGALVDTDGDGWSDIVDPTNGGTPLPLTQSDGDGSPDFLDVDSDGDGCYDAIEGAGSFVAGDLTTSNNLADDDEGTVDGNGVPTNTGSPQATNAFVTTAAALGSITTQPTASSICEGSSATFIVVDTGSNLRYRWQERIGAGSWTDLSNTGIYSGTDSATLNLTVPPIGHSGRDYRVIITSFTNVCKNVTSDEVSISIQSPPNAGSNGTLQICAGETVTAAELFTSLGGTPDGGGSWSPVLAGAGTYTYTVSGAPDCPDATADVVVNEQVAPNAGSNGTLQICAGETVTAAELFTSLGGTPDGGGSWSPVLAGAGTYTYTVSGAPDCPDATADVVVNEQVAPNAGSNGTLQICAGETVTAAELFTSLGGTPDGGGSWSPVLAGAGTYTYTVSGAPDCPDATADVVVNEQVAPNAGSNGTLQICAGETVTAAELFTSLGGTPDGGGSWSPVLAGAGTYTYTVSGAPDCPDATADVVVNEQVAPNAGSNGTLQICAGETVTAAELFTSLGGTPDGGGSWSPVLAGAGTYTYTVSGAPDCPDATADVVVNEQVAPNAGSNGTLQICAGETVTAAELFTSLGGTPDGGGSWSPVLAGAGTYTYTVSGAPDCPDATADVVVNEQVAPNAGSNGTLQICAGETVTAAELFTSLGGTPDGGGSWSPVLAGAGTYTYTVSGAPDCPDATADVVVNEQVAPNAGSNGTLQICAGETVTAAELFTSLGGTPDGGGSWSPVLAGAGTYTYTVSGAPDCPDATADVVVNEQVAPNAGSNGTLQICAGETVTAAELFTSLGGTPDGGGSWSPVLAGAGTYTYTVSGAPDCPDATADVVVNEQVAPNAGSNGTLQICAGETVTAAELFTSLGGTPDGGGSWSPVLAGAGTYTYTVSGAPDCPDATADVVVNEQVAPNAGSNGTLQICAGETVTAAELFTSLGGTPAGGGSWSPALAGAGTYTYTVSGAPDCPDATADVVVNEQVAPNAGSNGTLQICAGETVTAAELFTSLGGTPDGGGSWSPALAGAGTYTYTVSGAPDCPDATADVVVNEQVAPNAGSNGTLQICAGETVTAAELFTSLGGTPDGGGSWSPVLAGAGTYTYTVSGAPDCPDATADVVVNEQVAPNAGSNGTLQICAGETVTAAELFTSLGGTPDGGGSWSPVLAGAGTYTYTVSGAPDCPDATADVVVNEQVAPNAGSNGTLQICAGETVTAAELFTSLGGTPDGGGSWSPVLAGAGTYTYTVSGAPDCPDATADVVVNEQVAPNAGSNGTLQICAGETVTVAELFTSLGGTPDGGGSWSPVLAGAGTYTYTVSGAPDCPDATADVVVNEQVAPNAGSNGTLQICAGETVTAAELFTSLGGTPDGGGSWSPALAGAGTYTYTVSGAPDCPDATADVVVNEQVAPNAGSNGTLQICAGETVTAAELFTSLGGTPDGGGSWSPVLAGAGTYTYTVSGAPDCPDATADVVVNEQTAPNAGSNGTLQICAGETVTAAELFTSLGGTPDGGGSWSPVLAGAGTYTYTVSGAPDCPDATADVVVNEQVAPNAGSNGTLQICAGETVTAAELFTSLGGTPDGGGSWSPVLAGAGTYTYTVSGAPDCPDATADVVVNEQVAPNAGSNGTLQICAGETVTAAELFTSLGGTPDGGGSWSPVLAGAGTYTYTVSGAPDCPDVTADVVVNEQVAPNAGSNGTLQICAGETVTAAELFTSLGGTPDGGGSWSPVLAGAGTYTYTVSGAPDCPDATADVVVNEQVAPNAGSNGTLQICAGETVTAAELFTSLGGTPDGGGSWSPVLAGAGTYTYTVSGAPDCPDATADVVVNEQVAPNAGSNGTLQICAGETVTAAELFTSLGGTPDGGGSWSPVLAGAGTYTYTVSGAPDCPDATADVVVNEQVAPNAGSNGTLQICAGETVTAAELFTSLGGTPDGGGSWSPALAGAGTYTYTVSGAPDCPDATADVVVNEQVAPNAGSNGTLQICAGETVTAAELFTSLGGTPDGGGSWSPVLAGAGTYTYTVSGAPDCPDATADVVVNEQVAPNAGSNGTLQICAGETVTAAELFTSLGGTPDGGGSWSPVLAGAGTYTYTVSGAPDCPDATADIVVSEQALPDAGTNGTLIICFGETVTATQLFAELGGTPDAGGSWSPALAGAGVYTYTVSATIPCTVDAIATVTVSNDLTDTDGDGLTDCEETLGIDDPTTSEVPTGTSDVNDPCDPMHTVVALIDTDGDGLTDCEETTGIDNPATPEVPTGTSDENNPCDPMHTVVALTDSDGDGLTDCEETTGIDNPATPEVPTGTSDENNPCDPMHTVVALIDTDGDGLTDCEETTGIDNPATPEDPTTYGPGPFDPNNACDPVGITTLDSDGDGLTDCEESSGIDDPITPEVPTGTSDVNDACDPMHTVVALIDTDGDGLTDCEETTGIDNPTTPEVPTGISDENDSCDPMHTALALIDTDGDGLTDCEETTGIDNPATPEVPTGTSDENNPCDPMHTVVALTDSDGDGLTDCEETTGIDNPGTPEVPTGTSDENNPCDPSHTAVALTDTDGDGVTDCHELTPPDGESPTDPNDPCDAILTDITLAQTGVYLLADCDGDGVTNGDELSPPDGETPTDPNDSCSFVLADISSPSAAWNIADCDGDGVTNGDELNPPDGETPTNPNDPCSFVVADIVSPDTAWNLADCDGDGVTNGNEIVPPGGSIPTDPNDPCSFSPSDISAPVTTSADCTPGLEVTKLADVGGTALGDEIVYTIQVENTGNVVLNGISLLDSFTDANGQPLVLTSEPLFDDADLGSPEGTLQVGEIATYLASFEITQAAINAGGVMNSVEVSGTTPSFETIRDTSDDGDDVDGNTQDDPTETALGCLIVLNEFSPNDDGVNDNLVINCIENYPNNRLEIYNRWGNLVYKKQNYNNEFDGTSNGRSVVNGTEKLPVGTYYYVLDLGDGNKPKAGWIYINR